LAGFASLGFNSAGFTALVPEIDDLEDGERVARVALDGFILLSGSFFRNFPASSSTDIGGSPVERVALIDFPVSSCMIRRAIVDFGVVGGEGEGPKIGHEIGEAEDIKSALTSSPMSAERDRTGKLFLAKVSSRSVVWCGSDCVRGFAA